MLESLCLFHSWDTETWTRDHGHRGHRSHDLNLDLLLILLGFLQNSSESLLVWKLLCSLIREHHPMLCFWENC